MTVTLSDCGACRSLPITPPLSDNIVSEWISKQSSDAEKAVKGVVTRATSAATDALRDQVQKAYRDYALSHPNKVRASVAGTILVGVGAIAGLVALGRILHKG